MNFGHLSNVKRLVGFVLAACIFLAFGAESQPADSVITTRIDQGVTHLLLQTEGPNVVNVVVVDLRAKELRLESFRPVGLVPTSRQMSMNDRPGHRVVAAINADFFSYKSGWPVSNQVVNGQFALGVKTDRSHLLIDEAGRPHIERVSFDGWLKPKGGRQYQINGVNDVHRNNAIILHTSYSDTATNYTGPGKTFGLSLLDAAWQVGDTVLMTVDAPSSHDLLTIQKRQAVLWVGAGSGVWTAREDLKSGDTVLVYLGFRPDAVNIATALGGVGMIVSGGRIVDDSTNIAERTSFTFLRSRHPRTFVGFDRDTTKLFLCTVDGRQATSVGMNYREMADVLLSLGVWHAVNFDGGGSTTMVIRGSIVNSPSDKTGERAVANTLQLISTAPEKPGR